MTFNLRIKLAAAVSFVFLVLPIVVLAQTQLSADGQYCTSSATCQSGYCNTADETNVCASCSNLSDCNAGKTCISGTCQIGVLNSPCDPAGNNCQTGLICDSSLKTCQLPTPPSISTPINPVNVPGAGLNNISCYQGGCPAGLCSQNGVCIPKNQFTTGIASSQTLTELILKVVQALLAFAGVIAVVFVIIGGYLYMASGGNVEQAEKGKGTITNFVIGLVTIILAYMIVTILISTLTGQDKQLSGATSYYINGVSTGTVS